MHVERSPARTEELASKNKMKAIYLHEGSQFFHARTGRAVEKSEDQSVDSDSEGELL